MNPDQTDGNLWALEMWLMIPRVVLLFVVTVSANTLPPSSGGIAPVEQEQRRLESELTGETCYRWHTFGSGELGINSLEDLNNNQWTVNADSFNNPAYPTSPEYLTFYLANGATGFIEKELPEGGGFVRVRFGNVLSGTTNVEVGGVNVGTAVADSYVTVEADYINGDTIKIIEEAISVTNIWSIDVCQHEAGSCFHGDSTVLLESGSTKRLSELSLGERIKTSDGQGGFSFNPVLTLPHANNTEPAAFLTLTTETGKKVDMTSDHFIPKCDQEQVTAGELVVGDCLHTVDGKETLMEISSTAKNGVFTAITQDKFIVVDGVVASSFSKDSDPTKPELDYEKYRLELGRNRNRKLARMNKLLKRRMRRMGSAYDEQLGPN
jgi:hypothetical protein